jgi:hypothetical protein
VDGDGLQIGREAANIVKKTSQADDKGGLPAWGLGDGLTTPHHKTLIHYETRHTAPDLDKFFGTI